MSKNMAKKKNKKLTFDYYYYYITLLLLHLYKTSAIYERWFISHLLL